MPASNAYAPPSPSSYPPPAYPSANVTHDTDNFVYADDSSSTPPPSSGAYPPSSDYPDSFESDVYGSDESMPHFPPAATVTQGLSPLQRLHPWQWAIVGVAALVVSSSVGWTLYSRILNPSDPAPVDPNAPNTLNNRPPSTNDSNPAIESPATDVDVDEAFSDAVRLAQSALKATETASSAQDWSKIAKLWQDAAALMAVVPENDLRFQQARDRTVTYRSNAEYARQQVLQLLQPSN